MIPVGAKILLNWVDFEMSVFQRSQTITSQLQIFGGLEEELRQYLFSCMENKRVIFPEFEDPRILEAALVLEKWCGVEVLRINRNWILNRKDDVWQHLTMQAFKIQKPLPAHAAESAVDPLFSAGLELKKGACDAVIAGAVCQTPQVVRAILSTVGLRAGIRTLTSAFFMHLKSPTPGGQKILVFTDAGVIPNPTVEQLIDIASLGAECFRFWTKRAPQIGFLSFSTLGSANHPDVSKVQLAVKGFQDLFPELISVGEVQFDAAIVPEIAIRKMPNAWGQPSLARPGACNVLVFPDLDAGNICYKAIQRLAGADAWGPVILGAALPYSDLSRGCSVLDIVHVTALSLALAGASA